MFNIDNVSYQFIKRSEHIPKDLKELQAKRDAKLAAAAAEQEALSDDDFPEST